MKPICKNKHAHEGMPSGAETIGIVCIGFLIALGCGFVFSNWPGLDIEFSRSFTDESTRFFLQKEDIIALARKGILFAIFGFYVVVIGGWVDAYNKQMPVLGQEWHRWSFLGVSGIFGPVLIVNAILKSNWGRARPQFIEEFGGKMEFTPFWVWTDQCPTNCSFTSGEVAAVATVFLSLAFILRPIQRYILLFFGLVCTAIIAWKRLAFGEHFLSDTLMSVSLMCVSVSFVYWFYYLRPARWIDWFDEKQRLKLAAKKAKEI